ncbi:oxidase [Polyplosphaeria fusca]|uniref:Oxidase n=1 Tax=Polyplosphaeria fusca TaxID=682080 RepID=A0A9P4QKP3_9PLEO|nr:oxidase [Polyplosphaeria fusca]
MMFSARLALPLLGLSPFVHSFPTAQHLEKLNTGDLRKVIGDIQNNKRFLVSGGKPIDVSGKHAFQPPNFAAGDQRGPCPGLNALANHGYLPRDGVVNMVEIMAATNEVFGMSVEVGLLLGVMGTIWGGNPLGLDPGFSIGGEVDNKAILGNLGGLLGKPRGLEGTHNFIESDASNTRDDLYMNGDAATMNMTRFMDLYNSMKDGVLTFEDVGAQISKRFQESKAENPYFYSGPYTGIIARNAGYAFGSRLLSNHSKEFPLGQMTQGVMKSLWGVYDDDTAPEGMVYRRGHERIPENFYKIPVDYTLIQLNADLLAWYLMDPATLSIGGNMGKANSFVGLDLTDITGGVLNAKTLLEGNGLICFVLEVIKTFSPNLLGSLFTTLTEPLELITEKLSAPALNITGCPVLGDLKEGGMKLQDRLIQFPGAKRAGSAL